MDLFGLGTWIKIGALVALTIAGAIAMHRIAEHWRVEGDVRTHKKLDPIIAREKARADAAEARIVAGEAIAADLKQRYASELTLRLVAERQRDEQTRRARSALDRLAAAVSVDARVDLPADVGRVLDAASGVANGAGNPTDAAADGSGHSASIALPGGAATYRGTELARYFSESAQAFRVADEGWTSCVEQYNAAERAQAAAAAKGASNVNAQ